MAAVQQRVNIWTGSEYTVCVYIYIYIYIFIYLCAASRQQPTCWINFYDPDSENFICVPFKHTHTHTHTHHISLSNQGLQEGYILREYVVKRCEMCILCSSYHIYSCVVSYPALFVIVLCLLWSVEGLHMHISCIATIWYRASHGDIYLWTCARSLF